MAVGGSQRKRAVTSGNRQEPRSGDKIASIGRLLCRSRGMDRTIFIPGVPLRSTPGFYEFAFVKLLASVFSSVSRMRLSAEGSRI